MMDQHKLQTDTTILSSTEVPLQNFKRSQDVKDLSSQQTFQNSISEKQQNPETRKCLVKHDKIEEPDQLDDCFETLDLDRAKRHSIQGQHRFTEVNHRERHKSLVDRPQTLQCEVDLKRNEPRLYRWASERDSLTRQSSKMAVRPLSLSKLEEFDCTNKVNELHGTQKEDTGSFEVVHSKAPIATKLTRSYSRRSVDHTSRPDINEFVRSVATTGRVDPTEWHHLEHSQLLSASCSNIPETDEICHPNTAYSESNMSSIKDPRASFEDENGANPVVSVSMTSRKYKDIKIKDDKNSKEISQDCDISTVLYEVFETIMSNCDDNSIKGRVCSSIENIDELSKHDGSALLKCQQDIAKDVINNDVSDFSSVSDVMTNNDVAVPDLDYCNLPLTSSCNAKTLNNCSADILREVIELIQTALPDSDVSKISRKQEDSSNQNLPSTPDLFAALKWLLHKITDEEKIETGNEVLNHVEKPQASIDDNADLNEVFAHAPMYMTSVDYPTVDPCIDCDKNLNVYLKTDKESNSDETFWGPNIAIQENIEEKYEDQNYRIIEKGDRIIMNENYDVECHTNEVDNAVEKTCSSHENTKHTNDFSGLQTRANLIENCDLSSKVTNPVNTDDSYSLRIDHPDEDCHLKTLEPDCVDNSVNVFQKRNKINNCETFWDPPPNVSGSSEAKYLRQDPLESNKEIIRTRNKTEQESENSDVVVNNILIDKNLFANNMVSHDGHNYNSNQYYHASQDYQPLEKFVINQREHNLNTKPEDKSFDREFTLDLDKSISSGSQTYDVNESSDHHTTNKKKMPNSPYFTVENHEHQNHSMVSCTSKGSASDSSSMTSETSVKTDGTQTDSCSATVDYSYEIEKLRAERQRVCDMLTRCDYGHSRERVQAVEAKLNYGIGQMDTLLGYIELEPVRSSRVYVDRVLREKPAPKETADYLITTTTTTRRCTNNIVQNQNDYFRRLRLGLHQNRGNEASDNAKLVLGFDRSRNRVLPSDNIVERGRHNFTERYSKVFRPSNPVVTSFHPSHPVVTSSSFQHNSTHSISRNY